MQQATSGGDRRRLLVGFIFYQTKRPYFLLFVITRRSCSFLRFCVDNYYFYLLHTDSQSKLNRYKTDMTDDGSLVNHFLIPLSAARKTRNVNLRKKSVNSGKLRSKRDELLNDQRWDRCTCLSIE